MAATTSGSRPGSIFQKLPAKAASQIGWLLDKKDGWALISTCRDLRPLGQMIVYRNIELKDYFPRPKTSVYRLIELIREQPILGHFVETLNFSGLKSSPTSVRNYMATRRGDLVSSVGLKTFFAESGVPRRHDKEWRADIRAGALDACIALLVSMMPDLLMLTGGGGGMPYDSFFYLGHVVSRHETLQYVHLSPGNNEYSKSLFWEKPTNMPLFFYPRNLAHLSVTLENALDFSWPLPGTPTAKFLTVLEISSARENLLETVLDHIRYSGRLRVLSYTMLFSASMRFHDQANPQNIDLDKLSNAIYCCRETLEHVSINTMYFEDSGRDPGITYSGSLDLLKFMDCLTWLSVPWALAVGDVPDDTLRPQNTALRRWRNIAEMLPESIQRLTLSIWEHDLTSYLARGHIREGTVVMMIDTAVRHGELRQFHLLNEIDIPTYLVHESNHEDLRARLEDLAERFNLSVARSPYQNHSELLEDMLERSNERLWEG